MDEDLLLLITTDHNGKGTGNGEISSAFTMVTILSNHAIFPDLIQNLFRIEAVD